MSDFNVIKFRTKGYATDAQAMLKLTRRADIIGKNRVLVAHQDGRYFPVVIVTDEMERWRIAPIASANIMVIA